MISYAQNAEDVVLARALPGPHGFYLDVGAADPEIASVTKHFYDIGWRGINLEPRPEAAARLRQLRPRDQNLALAAGDADGRALLFQPHDDADQSTLDPGTRESLLEEGHGGDAVPVEVRTLDRILTENDAGAIDFVKIDVEGAEEQVLRGFDLRRWRPSVIVIEAVRPWSRERTDTSWRPLIEAAGYREGGFDGINLFFAPTDRPDILAALSPASVLDDFVPAGVDLLHREIVRLREYVSTLDDELARHRTAQSETEAYVLHLQASLAEADDARAVDPTNPPDADAPTAVSALTPARRPTRPSRLAVIGTPRAGNTWIRRVLADTLDAVELPVDHPADLPWGEFPLRTVIQLHWPRTTALEQALADEDFLVVSPARQPLDVLTSMLQFVQKDSGPMRWLSGRAADIEGLIGAEIGDSRFTDWASGPGAAALLAVTPDWWQTPATLRARYEDLCDSPEVGFAALLDAAEVVAIRPLAEALQSNTADRINQLSGGVHVWRGRPGMGLETLTADQADRLTDAHRKVFAALGY